MFRTISLADIPQILTINDQVQGHPWTTQDIEREITKNHPCTAVAWAPGTGVLGYIFVRSSGDDLEILSIGVRKDFQRRGIGRALLYRAIASKSLGGAVFLEVSNRNTEALAFYEKLGFQRQGTRKGYYRDGADAFNMKLDLAKTQCFC